MQTLPSKIDLTGCAVAEKLDGIQARWNGQHLTTRTGNEIHAPAWWTEALPDRPVVGELWAGRGSFQELQSIVCRSTPDDRWRQVEFINFATVDQVAIESPEHFEAIYRNIVDHGGEGVVITDADGTQFKKKPVDDDDGQLIELVAGNGKYEGMVNGFVLKNRSGQVIRISAGLTDDMRINPPAIGSIVRYRYNGLTKKGLPRHARFDGVRAESTMEF